MSRSFTVSGFLSCRKGARIITAILCLICSAQLTFTQTEDLTGDSAADPIVLFERGQNAHAHGDLEKALAFYNEAIKVRPEFPEAEFQRANALVSLLRLAEAEAGFRRAIELRKDWSSPYAALGTLLVRLNRDREAEPMLLQALKLDGQNNLALRLLADITLRKGDAKQALEFARRATNDKEAPASAWIMRAMAERATSDRLAAMTSLDHALQLEPQNASALEIRAEIHIDNGNYELAIADLKTAEKISNRDKRVLATLAIAYQRAGNTEEARRAAEAAGLVKAEDTAAKGTINVVGTPEEIEAANSEDAEKSRRALEKLLEKNPENPLLMARLGAAYRAMDPARSLDLYRRAAEIQPNNPDYSAGYASALVQARRFAEAVVILRRVLAATPDNYPAHANLATAYYELKQYTDALGEYQWLLKTRPDLPVVYYFIATVYDRLGQYADALSAYETFLGRADAKTNSLEIEKVKLRLPSLRRQIQLKQGVKRKS